MRDANRLVQMTVVRYSHVFPMPIESWGSTHVNMTFLCMYSTILLQYSILTI